MDVDVLDDGAKKTAIDRMKLPASNRKHMPPALFRSLDADALEAAISALSPK